MFGKILSVGVPKADRNNKLYRSVLVEARIPCYWEDVKLEVGLKYNLILLSKHDFVEITEAKKLEGV